MTPRRTVLSIVFSDMTFRILGPHERGRFAPDAWGQLLALSRSGVVSATELEQLIERALVQIDGRIALDDLRALVEGAGLPAPASESRETVH
jgi:Smg protein